VKSINLGQHFLVNPNAAAKIVAAFLPVSGPVLEIGPGKGILTEGLLSRLSAAGTRYTAIELDPELATNLKYRLAHYHNLEVLAGDFLEFSLDRLVKEGSGRIHLIGNIPYYISRDIFDRVIQYQGYIERGVFMTQKEFALKILVGAGDRQSNAQSIMLHYLFKLERLFDVQPGSFAPPPRVKSTVFRLQRLEKDRFDRQQVKGFYRFLQYCFAQRRKTLVNNLTIVYPAAQVMHAFEKARLATNLPAEALPLERFFLLFSMLNSASAGQENA